MLHAMCDNLTNKPSEIYLAVPPFSSIDFNFHPLSFSAKHNVDLGLNISDELKDLKENLEAYRCRPLTANRLFSTSCIFNLEVL